MSEEVLRMIIEAVSAHQVWPSLEEQLLPMMKEKIVYLKDHQMNLKKGSLITNEYIQKFKTIYDSLTAVNKPVDDGDKEFQLAQTWTIISRLQSSNTSKISMPYILSVHFSLALHEQMLSNEQEDKKQFLNHEQAFFNQRGRGRNHEGCFNSRRGVSHQQK